MWNAAGILLSMALSTSCGRLVAPMTSTQRLVSEMRPSHSDMNMAFIMAVASWSWVARDRRNESAGMWRCEAAQAGAAQGRGSSEGDFGD